MIRHNELVIDGVKTSSFPFKIIVHDSPSVTLGDSKTNLLEHDGISGAIVQTNKHRELIKKPYTIYLVKPTEEQLNQFMSLFIREKFWLENERVKTTRLWCYKASATDVEQEKPGLYVTKITFICHPTKFFKTQDVQIINASGEVLRNSQTVWFDISQREPGVQHVHIKYSRYPDGREMGNAVNMYVGVAKTTSANAPSQPAAYRWQRLQGRNVELVWANSSNGQLDYTKVGPNPTAKIVAKGRPRFEAKDNTDYSVMDIWQTRQQVRLKPNTTYTLTARGCSKHYTASTTDYRAYLFMDFGFGSPIRESIDFTNRAMETKKVTFRTPSSVSESKPLTLRAQADPEDADWTGLCLDWYVLVEGTETYQTYPDNEPARVMKYRHLGVVTTTETLAGGGGTIQPQGSALAFPKITIKGESEGETHFTIGNQTIRLASLSGSYVMINDPREPSFKDSKGKSVKWSGDFITVDGASGRPIGVVLGPGIQSLTFETVWGWA